MKLYIADGNNDVNSTNQYIKNKDSKKKIFKNLTKWFINAQINNKRRGDQKNCINKINVKKIH